MNKKQNKKIKIPKFKNEDQERDFWSEVDLSDYFNKNDFQKISFPNLKPSTKTISLRLPESLLYSLKEKANKRDIPYQSLMKMILDKELKKF